GKPFVPKGPGPELPREEQVTLEPELEEALANATDAEMCDIAAILGMYTLMSNKQYYDAICSGNICNTEGINSVVQPDHYWPVPHCPHAVPINVPTLSPHLSLRCHSGVTPVSLRCQSGATPVPLWCHCGVPQAPLRCHSGVTPVPPRCHCGVPQAVAAMLEQNQSLQSLNLESNFITSAGMLRVLAAVGHCRTLTELRVDNQCQRLGDSMEVAMAAMLERCPAVLRFGYTFTLQGPRARAAAALTRNNELR
ncbi:TMOD4 protein, partial [Rhagologus leucostigma]|nr:TMOD4 protein [Rhagologus leucostigma]